jgi:hypothetical protein
MLERRARVHGRRDFAELLEALSGRPRRSSASPRARLRTRQMQWRPQARAASSRTSTAGEPEHVESTRQLAQRTLFVPRKWDEGSFFVDDGGRLHFAVPILLPDEKGRLFNSEEVTEVGEDMARKITKRMDSKGSFGPWPSLCLFLDGMRALRLRGESLEGCVLLSER